MCRVLLAMQVLPPQSMAYLMHFTSRSMKGRQSVRWSCQNGAIIHAKHPQCLMLQVIRRSAPLPQAVWAVPGLGGHAYALATSPDGGSVAVGCGDKTVRLWRPTGSSGGDVSSKAAGDSTAPSELQWQVLADPTHMPALT